MMKKITVLIVLVLASWSLFAQMYNPVSWEFESKKLSDTEYELIFTATIEEGSAMYSQHIKEGGPVPTTFTFVKDTGYELIGKVVESNKNKETKHDAIFNMDLTKFHNEAIFKQKVKVTNPKIAIKGDVNFMSCNDHECTPPTSVEFSFTLTE